MAGGHGIDALGHICCTLERRRSYCAAAFFHMVPLMAASKRSTMHVQFSVLEALSTFLALAPPSISASPRSAPSDQGVRALSNERKSVWMRGLNALPTDHVWC